jgi:hypothetical protein
MRGTKRTSRNQCIAWSALAILMTAGCAPLNLRGSGYGDYTSNWGQKLRPQSQPGQSVGLDRRAQEIEQNLGIR